MIIFRNNRIREIEVVIYIMILLYILDQVFFLILASFTMSKHNINSLVKRSRNGDLEGIEQLLCCNVDVNAPNKKDQYPLIEAVISGHFGAVKRLLKAGADPNSALWCASMEGNREMVEILLKAGGDANNNEHGRIPLYSAVWYGNLEVVKLLLDHGADVNAKSRGSKSALSTAIDVEEITIAKLLLKRGANVNAESLQVAIYRKNIEMVIILVDKGVDVNAKGGLKGSALEMAYKQDNDEIIEILRVHGARTTRSLLDESLNEPTSFEETSEGFSGEDISEEESSDETTDEQSLSEDIGDEESLSKESTEEVTLKAENRDQHTWREDTEKQVIWEERASVSEESVQEEISKEETVIASDKTSLIWAYEHHNLDEARRLLSGHTVDTSQPTLGEKALILAMPKIPQILDKEMKEILELLGQIINIVTKML